MTDIKKTLVRRLKIRVDNRHALKATVVIYIQPNGLMAIRFARHRKRYWIPMSRVLAMAIKNGPADGLLEVMLDEKTKQKRGNHAKIAKEKDQKKIGPNAVKPNLGDAETVVVTEPGEKRGAQAG